jgi:hypothetical protein
MSIGTSGKYYKSELHFQLGLHSPLKTQEDLDNERNAYSHELLRYITNNDFTDAALLADNLPKKTKDLRDLNDNHDRFIFAFGRQPTLTADEIKEMESRENG